MPYEGGKAGMRPQDPVVEPSSAGNEIAVSVRNLGKRFKIRTYVALWNGAAPFGLGEFGANKSPLTPLLLRGESALPPFSKGGQGGFWVRTSEHLNVRTKTRCTPFGNSWSDP
jgi:hypothetical protein